MERKINGNFEKVRGGYARKINEYTTEFIPDCSASTFNPNTGELKVYAPDYEKLEREKSPSINATIPGEYAYRYETQNEPTGCDFSLELAYYGDHYFIHPLHLESPELKGRGIKKLGDGDYVVTELAYSKLKTLYKFEREMLFD